MVTSHMCVERHIMIKIQDLILAAVCDVSYLGGQNYVRGSRLLTNEKMFLSPEVIAVLLRN